MKPIRLMSRRLLEEASVSVQSFVKRHLGVITLAKGNRPSKRRSRKPKDVDANHR